MLIRGTIRGKGNVGSITNLSTGAAADRRLTISGSSGKLQIYNDGAVMVYWLCGDSTVDLTDLTNADGYMFPDSGGFIDVAESQAGAQTTDVSFFSSSDTPTLHHGEVE